MSTRSSARRLLSPIEDPERLLSRRNRSEPSLLFDLEEDDMVKQVPPQGPIPDLRPIEELLQAPTDGVGDAIGVPFVLANQFELKIGLLNLVTAITFHGFENDDPHSHIRRFMKITQTVKLNNVPSDVVKLLFFYFLLIGQPGHGLKKNLPILSQLGTIFLNQSEQNSLNSAAGGNFLTKNTQEALTIIENKYKVQTSRNKHQVASSSRISTQDAHITSLTKQVEALLSLHRLVNSVQNGCKTCAGPHAYYECQAAGGYTQEDVYATTSTYNQGGNSYLPQVLPSNTIPNPREYLKVITTWSGVTLAGPSIPPPPPFSSTKEVEREPESTTDQVLTESTTRVPPLVVQPSPASTFSELPPAPVSSPMIPNFLQMFKKLYFNISLAEALAHMPKFDKMVKDLLNNKEKLLELCEYDTWRLRIESYIQLQDYALWEIIEEGNSFKPVARTTTNEDGTSTTTIPGAVTAEQKILKKNDLKARSILMMTLPSEHLLTFNKHKDAKSLFEAIEARFGGNEATKKTQKTLLKQMYETFNASSSESLDSIFNRLQKIVSQLTILGEIITPEELNLKFLRSLPTEWGMHVVVWRNKSDLGSISFDDLYNNFKIVEPEVKRSVISSSNSGSQNLAFLSGHSSTNDVNTANVHVSTGSTPVSTASTNNSTACLSDATVYAYLATQPNGSQVVHEDLEQIHEDDLDEMDLKWQLALLSMKARKFYQRTGKKIIINGSDTAGYDKKKVECFNCHKLGHFARECRNPRSQENRNRSQDSSRRTVNVEESSSKAMLAIDGTGFDWSYMADEEASTNFALMAFSDSEVQNNKTCSKTCLKNFEDLKSKYDKLRIELNKSESDLDSYKKGLALVEEQLVFYKKNESMLCDQIVVLKRDASFNESDINALKKQVERLKKEKEDNQFKIDNFENASKSLFVPPSIDLSNSGLEKFKQPEFEGYGVKVNKGASENVSREVKKTSDAPIIEDWVSDYDEDEAVVLKSLNVQKPKQTDQPRKDGTKPVLNNVKKGTGQREVRPVWTNAMRVNHQKFSNSRRNFAPTAVLTKSGLVPFSTARQSFSRTTAPVSAARSFNTAVPSVISVNTVKGKRMTSAVGEQGINAIKPTTYWAWRPKIKMINHVYKNTGSCIWQMATGKESSNPFMAGSLPKTISLMIHLSQKSKESHAQTLTMLMKKVKRLEDKLKSIFEEEYRKLCLVLILLEAKDSEVCKITRADGSSSFHGDIQALLRRLNRQDLNGTSIQINMLVEKKYPLKKEILEKIINLKIEAEEESTMAHELIKFIKSQIAEHNLKVNHKFRGGLLGIKELLQDNAAEGLNTASSNS
ncbi:putative ribonuclease H-like domain-containing protein [Tanacetum coccineum]